MQTVNFAELYFADNMANVEENEKKLQHNLNIANEQPRNIKMKINEEKKTMIAWKYRIYK